MAPEHDSIIAKKKTDNSFERLFYSLQPSLFFVRSIRYFNLLCAIFNYTKRSNSAIAGKIKRGIYVRRHQYNITRQRP